MNKNQFIKPLEAQYLDLLQYLLYNGQERNNERTGTGTRSTFGYSLRHNLNAGFPLLTTKRVFWRAVVEELAWFLRGSTDVKELQNKGIHIWDKDAERYGSTDLGRVYGAQWREWEDHVCSWGHHDLELDDIRHIDQIANLLKSLKDDPQGRRHILTAWNVADLNYMALPPCHYAAQFYVSNPLKFKPALSCMFHMRSSDVFLGLPFNIASYALLTHLMAHVLGYGVGELIVTIGDAHLYSNHFEQAKKQLERVPKTLPELKVLKIDTQLRELDMESIELIGYNPHGRIKAPLSV